MNDFDLKKYLSNNPLHQSNIGGFSITELQQTTKSDFEIGLAILNEMGYDFSEELLTEIKLPSWVKNFGKNLRSKVFSKIKNTKSKKEAKNAIQTTLDQIKLLSTPEQWEKISKLDFTSPDYLKQVSNIIPQSEITEQENDDISKSDLEKSANKRKFGSLAMLTIYIGMLASSFNIGSDVIKDYAKTTNEKSTSEIQAKIKSQKDAPNIFDIQPDPEGDNVYKTQHQKGESDIDDKEGEAKKLIKALGIDKMSKGTKAKLGVKGKISSTLGDQDDNPNGPKKKGLGQDRLDQGKEVLGIAKEIAADEYGVDIDIEDQGTNVKDALADKSNELDADSKEALSGQTTDYTLLDVDTGDTGGDDVDDTDVDEGDLIFPPTDKIWFANKRPESVKTKYEVVFMQILPSLIGDGEPEFYKNDEFKEILKYVGTIKGEKQSFNEKFIKDRIDPDGVLQQALKDPKYKDVKDKIQNTINVLDWVKFSTKNPSTLGNLFKKLDPNIKLGDRKANKALPGKAGQAAKQPGTKSTPSGKSFDTNLRETVLNEIKSILFEKYDIQNLSTFNKEAATNNLGLLVPLYSDTWGLASDEGVTGIEYDAEYLGDKYKNSLNKLKTIFPKVKTVVGTSVKLKDKETTQPTKTGDAAKPSDPEQTTDPTKPKDKKEKEHAKSSRLAAIEKEIESKKSLQVVLKLIDQNQEIDPFIFGLLALINDKFENDQSRLRIILQGAINKFNQQSKNLGKSKGQSVKKSKGGKTKIGGFNYATKADISEDIKKPNSQVIKALEALKNNPIIGPRLDQLVTNEEAINLITDIFFDLDDPELRIFPNADPSEVKQGLERALKLFQGDPDIKKSFQNQTGKDDQEIGLDVFYKGYTSSSSDYKVKEALIKEGLTEDESKAVLDKYKQRYAAVLKSNPDFIKKYPNPDKVIYGMVMNEVKKLREKLGKKADVGDYKKDFRKSDAPQFKGKSKKKRDEMATAAFLSQQDKLKEGDLDVGHQDDEPRMLKKDIYNMGKYAMEIYKKLDRYDDMEGEVDFPHWWQSKLTKAKSMLQSAYDYLDGEEKISQIDAIMEKEEKLPVNDIKKAIRALLKKEGGAAGLGPILKLAKDFNGVTQIDVEDILDNDMKDVEKHRDGDYILKETGQEIAKKNMDDYKRLNELVKAALMGPISEKQAKPDFLDLDGDGDKEESMKQAAADKKKMEEESTPKYDDDPALKGKQSKLPDGLQKAIIKKKGGKVDEAEVNEINIMGIGKLIQTAKSAAAFIQTMKKEFPTASMRPSDEFLTRMFNDLKPELSESFDSLVKKVDKEKGYDKEDAKRVAGYIANRKRAGAGKGPTKKMKKREGIKERILRELRGQ